MVIRFTAKVTPHGKQRARTVTLPNGRRTSYTPKDTVQFENTIAWAFKSAARGARFGEKEPLKVTAIFFMPIPKSLSKRQQERLNGEWHTSKPDADNVQKSVQDALNNLAYHDDGQIAWLDVKKIYSDCPRVEVMIERLESRKGVQND